MEREVEVLRRVVGIVTVCDRLLLGNDDEENAEADEAKAKNDRPEKRILLLENDEDGQFGWRRKEYDVYYVLADEVDRLKRS